METLYLDSLCVEELQTISGWVIFTHQDNIRNISMPALLTVGEHLQIKNNAGPDAIYLPSLKTVGHHFTVYNNDALPSLRLHNLTSVGQYLRIQNHALLRDIDFPSLKQIGYYLEIFDNEALRDVDFDVLESLGSTVMCYQSGDHEHICVDDNEALDNVSFPLLRPDDFDIFVQPGTPDAYACAHYFFRDPWCARVGDGRPTSATVCETDARIQTQEVLVCNYTIPMNTSLVTEVRGNLELIGTGDTFGYVALPSLVSVGGDLYISGISSKRETFTLPKLVNVSGGFTIKWVDCDEGDWAHRIRRLEFPSLRAIGGFAYLYYNRYVAHLDIGSLETIGTYFTVSSTGQLYARTRGERDLASKHGRLYRFLSNQYLAQINLPALARVGGYLYINSNQFAGDTSRASVQFPELRSIDGRFYIYNNQYLRTIAAPKLENISGVLEVTYGYMTYFNMTALERTGGFNTNQASKDATYHLDTWSFPSLHTIDGYFQVYNNYYMGRLEMPRLREITSYVYLYNSGQYGDDGGFEMELPNLQTVGSYMDVNNWRYGRSWNLTSLRSIGSYFRWRDNSYGGNDNDVLDFPALETIGRYDDKMSAIRVFFFNPVP